VVFSKEDIITKKKLTKFLLGYDIRFQPDQHHRGNYEAVIKIQGFNKPEKA
jgi:hypothetical protein